MLKVTLLASVSPFLIDSEPPLVIVRLLPRIKPSKAAEPPRAAVPPVTFSVNAAPLVPMELLMLTVLALKLKVLGSTPIFAIGELIEMLLEATNDTSAALSKFVNAAAVIWLEELPKLALLSRSVGNRMSSPVVPSPLMFAVAPFGTPATTVIFAGSSNNKPCRPRRALRSAVPRKYSTCLPDVSPVPPSPPLSPPFALRCPAKWVSLSAQTMILPPSP